MSKDVKKIEGSEKLLHDFDVSRRLGISINTLRNWRYQGKGPKFVKLEKRSIMYRQCDVDAYINNQVRG